ncbi:MAG: hypothetical protein RR136_05430, partial [Clostridia bacterium]
EISKTLLISYIEIFKHLDILYIESNFINKDFIKLINNINKEYGTSIAFIKDFDLKRYDIYLVFNNVDLSNYLLNKKSKYINLINSDNDIYSKEYLIYKKYENELINTDRYSKTKIGKGIINLLDI